MEGKKGISKKGMQLLLVVFGILIFVACYAGLRPGLVTTTEQLEAEKTILSGQLAQLLDLEANEATYVEQSKLYEQEISGIIEKYPVNIKEEDVILYARDLAEDADVSIKVIGLTEGNLLAAIGTSQAPMGEPEPAPEGEEAAAPAATGYDLGIMEVGDVVCPDYSLYGMNVSYDFTSDYDNMKSIFARIVSNRNKRNISAMSLTYDTHSGMIVGNISINMFYLTGTDKIYQEPDAGTIEKGNDNIFSTLHSPNIQ